MKKKDLPQDDGALANFTKEICYVKNEKGQYEPVLSTGWEVKTAALDSAWEEVNRRISEARTEVAEGRKSPIYYFMELRLMDIPILAAYTGFWKFSVKRHMRPPVFRRMREERLKKYAEVFEISIEELKNFKG